jgi:hypothetical protein
LSISVRQLLIVAPGHRRARRSEPKIWIPAASASFWLSVCPVTPGCAPAQAAALLRLVKKLMKPPEAVAVSSPDSGESRRSGGDR